MYETVLFADSPDWSAVPVAAIDSFHWEKETCFRPASFAQLCGITKKGLAARLWSFEENPRCTYTRRDDPIYQDSCLEFFINPLAGRSAGYLNVECNANGVFLSQFGMGRENRRLLCDCTVLAPDVTPFTWKEHDKTAWGVEIFLPDALIETVYEQPYHTQAQAMRGNFYKCGDLTEIPHFGAFSPVNTAELGFHNPECFAEISIL